MSNERQSPTPWYRQFWPWFLIALPACVVVASLVTVYIAVDNADSLVDDNYYKEGLAINEQRALDRAAAAMDLEAKVTFDGLTGEVVVDLAGGAQKPGNLQLLLSHPLNAELDRTLELVFLGQGRYRADVSGLPPHRYYLRLMPAPDPAWRLDGEIDLDAARKARLTPDV